MQLNVWLCECICVYVCMSRKTQTLPDPSLSVGVQGDFASFVVCCVLAQVFELH